MAFKEDMAFYIIFGVFALSIITFAVQFQNDNSVTNQSVLTSQIVNVTYLGLNSSLNSITSTTNNQTQAFQTQNPIFAFGYLVSTAIIGAGTAFTGFVTVILSLIGTPLQVLFGIPAVISGAFLSIFMIGIIFTLWRTYRLGG